MSNTDTTTTTALDPVERITSGIARFETFNVRPDLDSASYDALERTGEYFDRDRLSRGIDVDTCIPHDRPSHSTVYIHGATSWSVDQAGDITFYDEDGRIIATINSRVFSPERQAERNERLGG